MRGIIQVTTHATDSAHLLTRIDVEGGQQTTILSPRHAKDTAIVVTASSPGLRGDSVSIPVSTNQRRDSVLAVAARVGQGEI